MREDFPELQQWLGEESFEHSPLPNSPLATTGISAFRWLVREAARVY